MCRELDEIIPEIFEATRPDYLIGATLKVTRQNWSMTAYKLSNDKCLAEWHTFRSFGLVVIHNAYVTLDEQGKGLGKYLAKLRCDAFEVMKQGYQEEFPCENINMVCRVAAHNEKQIHIMQSLGWIRLNEVIWTRP
jgi:hypothetical protein